MHICKRLQKACQMTPSKQYTDWNRNRPIESEKIHIWRTSLMRCSPLSYFQWRCTRQQLLVRVKSHFSLFPPPRYLNVSKSTLSEQCAFPAAKRRGKQLLLPDAACWMECKYVNHLEFIAFECSSNAMADTSLIYDIPLITRAVEIHFPSCFPLPSSHIYLFPQFTVCSYACSHPLGAPVHT